MVQEINAKDLKEIILQWQKPFFDEVVKAKIYNSQFDNWRYLDFKYRRSPDMEGHRWKVSIFVEKKKRKEFFDVKTFWTVVINDNCRESQWEFNANSLKDAKEKAQKEFNRIRREEW